MEVKLIFFTVQKRIKEIIESEAVPEGSLSDISSIHLGDFKLLANNQYPALFVDYSSGGADGFPLKVDIDLSYTVFIYVLEDSYEKSMQKLDDLYWKDEEEPTGIIPVLLRNMGFMAGNTAYRLKIGETRAVSGKPESDRWSGALMIPLEIKSLKHL